MCLVVTHNLFCLGVPLDFATCPDSQIGEVADDIAVNRGFDGVDGGLTCLDAVNEVGPLILAFVELLCVGATIKGFPCLPLFLAGIDGVAVNADPAFFAKEGCAMVAIGAVFLNDGLGCERIHEVHLDPVFVGAFDIPCCQCVKEAKDIRKTSCTLVADWRGVIHIQSPLCNVNCVDTPACDKTKRIIRAVKNGMIHCTDSSKGFSWGRPQKHIVIQLGRDRCPFETINMQLAKLAAFIENAADVAGHSMCPGFDTLDFADHAIADHLARFSKMIP